MKKLYLVETVSIFRQRYVVEAHEAEHAADEVVMNTSGAYSDEFKEFSQKHIDECITSTRELSIDEYVELFDEDNDYLKNWDLSQKMQYINTIKYDAE
jgi:hypothetical protein